MIRYPPGRLARRTSGISPGFIAIGVYEADTGSQAYNYPAGIAIDDVLLFIVETGPTDAAPIAPAGWAEVTNSPSEDTTGTSSNNTRLSVFWKRYTATESTVFMSDCGDRQVGVVAAFRNCIPTGNPWDITAKAASGASTTAISCPTVTTTIGNCLILALASTAVEASSNAEFSGWTNANLTGVTEFLDNTSIAGTGGGFGGAYGIKALPGATGATTATAVNSEHHAYLVIALRGQI